MENLIADWVEYASLPMMSDGVITWHAKGKEALLSDAMSIIEVRCDLNFERVNKRRDAEIHVIRMKKLIKGAYAGSASWGKDTNYRWKLRSVRKPEYASTIIHELGHALGLQHPEDHSKNKKTIMSYERNPNKYSFMRQDFVNVNEIYNPDKSDKIVNPYVNTNDMKTDVSLYMGVHKECISTVDYITGMPLSTHSI